MRQMLVRTQRIPTGDTLGRYVLEARAQQAIKLLGYRMDLTFKGATDFNDSEDELTLSASLLAAPRGTTGVPIIGDALLDGLNRTRSLQGFLTGTWNMVGIANASGGVVDPMVTTGWTPCDFLVPGLWITCSNSPINTTSVGMLTLTILMDWETIGATALAALYTTYGIDSVDSTERQAVGEVDFNRAIGEGAIPPIIG